MATVRQFLTDREIAALFAVITDRRDRALFFLIYELRLSLSTVCSLQLRDYDKVTRLLQYRQEGIPRKQHLCRAAHSMILWLRRRGREPGPLFLTRFDRSNRLVTNRSQLLGLFRAYCAEASCEPIMIRDASIAAGAARLIASGLSRGSAGISKGQVLRLFRVYCAAAKIQAEKAHPRILANSWLAEFTESLRDWR